MPPLLRKRPGFMKFFLALLLCLLPTLLWADDVIFFKNSGELRMYVWVNGSYQGFVDPNTTVYMPRGGFVTPDSGFQPDGTLKQTYSHGGWEKGGLFEYEAFSAPFQKGETTVAYYTIGTVPYKEGGKLLGVACGNGAKAVLPTDIETEHAGKMRGDKPPGDLRSLLAKKRGEAEDEGKTGGSITEGAAFPLWFAGYKKEEGIKPGTTFTNSLGMKMIWVKEGRYYLAATELTQGQWSAIIEGNPSKFKGSNLPIEQISWDHAVAYCEHLTTREQKAGKLPKGYIYALPSEKQWETACRAGTTGDYAGPLDAMAWYGENSGERTHPVATKQANSWGFYDMHGNVWEWCSDAHEYGRANRGGSWFNGAHACSSDYVYGFAPGFRISYLGFRPALIPSK